MRGFEHLGSIPGVAASDGKMMQVASIVKGKWGGAGQKVQINQGVAPHRVSCARFFWRRNFGLKSGFLRKNWIFNRAFHVEHFFPDRKLLVDNRSG